MRLPALNRFRTVRRLTALFGAALATAVGRAATAENGFSLIYSYSAVEVGADVVGLRAVQAPDGVIYFGSNSLLSYDGDRWLSYPVAGSYGLYGLDLGSDGRLWAGAVGEIGWFDRDTAGWHYHSLRGNLPRDEAELGPVAHAFAFRNGAVFATLDRLLYWDGASVRTWSMPGTRRVHAFRVGDDIFVQHERTGLYVMRAEGPRLFATPDLIGTDPIMWVGRDGPDLRLLNGAGLFRLQAGKFTRLSGTGSDFVRDHKLTMVVELRDGRLAVGTMADGIVIVTPDGALESAINQTSGLESAYVLPLLCDRDGVLWAGSRAAIFRIPIESRSTLFDRRAKVPLQPPLKLGRHDGKLVLANTEGIYELDAASRQFSRHPLATSGLFDFHSSPDGLMIAGYRGVTRLAQDKATVLHATIADVLAIVPSRSHRDHFFIAAGTEILELTAAGATRVIAKGLPDTANSIAEDADGNLWLGTKAHGIFSAASTATEVAAHRVGEEAGLANPRGDSRVIATNDSVVAFTPLGAWVRQKQTGRFLKVDRAPARTTTAAASGRDGATVWVIHRSEAGHAPMIGRISLLSSGARWDAHAIDGLDRVGVPRSLFAEPAGATTTLWIGGTEGVLRHDFTGVPTVPLPRTPLIHAVARTKSAGVQPVMPSIALPASTQSIAFEFSIPDFGRRAALELQTCIDGIDDGWVTVGAGSRRELNVIGQGAYKVRARAVAESGVASAEASLSFEVLKPWWRTAPAMGGMAVAVVLLASGVYQLRIRRLRRHNAELEAKVRLRTKELERASAAKTEFVANMSHDIRNPLNGIVGLALALEDSRLDARQQEIVATLRECTTYLSTLVDDVLDFASIEAGRVELRPGAFNAGELLRSIVTTLKTDAIQSGATLEVELDPDLPERMTGDAGRIQQILVNYVSNALKYAGGRIRISAIAPAQAPGEIEFAVADQGPGLSEADQATLFTKFSRSPQARQLAIPGSGLGLAACRLLADIMGGSVGLASRPGEGARFFLRLPLVVAPEPTTEAAAELPNSTVLLVEDTDYNAWAASAVLARLGLRCERARDGAEALRLFAEKRFNVVLLDRNLPDLDGTEVARRMRAMEGDGAQALLLAITAYCTEKDRTLCFEAGMDAFVGKPLTPEKLRKVLIAAAQRVLGTASVQVPADIATPAPAELDTGLLSYLGEGTSAGLSNQIQRFVTMLEADERELSAAVIRSDPRAVAALAHRLLGHARMVGSSGLADAAIALEHEAAAGDLSSGLALLAAVGVQVDRVTAALRLPRNRQTA